ncbi:cutinase family protein [soil metagenome]
MPAIRLSAFVVAILSAFAVSGVGTPAASAAPSCPDIEVVFARGTDEPPGIGRVGKALVDSLKPLVKGKSIGTYAVDYPASYDFLAVAGGANDASTHIQSMAVKCPKTKMVLGGYSQGAAVIDVITTAPVKGLGFAAPMPAAVADHVAAVAVFGNPSARLGQPLTRMSQLYGAKTADMCNVADPICSLGNNFDSHVKYPESGLVKTAAKWAADHILQVPQQNSTKAETAKKVDRPKS